MIMFVDIYMFLLSRKANKLREKTLLEDIFVYLSKKSLYCLDSYFYVTLMKFLS